MFLDHVMFFQKNYLLLCCNNSPTFQELLEIMVRVKWPL